MLLKKLVGTLMNGFTASKMNLCVDTAATTAVYTHKVLGKI